MNLPTPRTDLGGGEKPVDNMVIKIGLNVDLFALSGRLS